MEGAGLRSAVFELHNITKKYGGTVALDNVDFELLEHEVLGLVGDNGAGKSTLIKVISGAVIADSGEIFFEGQRVKINSPSDSIKLGIETIYQDLALFGRQDFTVNIFSGREYLKSGYLARMLRILDKKRMQSKAREVLMEISINMPSIREKVDNFSGGQKQAIAISRAILWGRKVIIMDEPTAALGVQESRIVLNMIKNFAKKETVRGVIIISHNIEHISEIADRVVVLRQGKRVGSIDMGEYKERKDSLKEDIIKMITGLGPPSGRG
jgi:ABC-type sugar transport system ATPase subunit